MQVSLGSGNTPPGRRERSLSTYLETGGVLIESATDTERIAGALATLAPLVPGLRYFRCLLFSSAASHMTVRCPAAGDCPATVARKLALSRQNIGLLSRQNTKI